MNKKETNCYFNRPTLQYQENDAAVPCRLLQLVHLWQEGKRRNTALQRFA